MHPSELRTRRKALRLSQDALATLLKVARSTVNRWETGHQPIAESVNMALTLLEGNKYVPPSEAKPPRLTAAERKFFDRGGFIPDHYYRLDDGTLLTLQQALALPEGAGVWLLGAYGRWQHYYRQPHGRRPEFFGRLGEPERPPRWRNWRPWYDEPLPTEVINDV